MLIAETKSVLDYVCVVLRGYVKVEVLNNGVTIKTGDYRSSFLFGEAVTGFNLIYI